MRKEGWNIVWSRWVITSLAHHKVHAADPSVIIQNPVITLYNCYPFTSILWISWKAVKLDTAIPLN